MKACTRCRFISRWIRQHRHWSAFQQSFTFYLAALLCPQTSFCRFFPHAQRSIRTKPFLCSIIQASATMPGPPSPFPLDLIYWDHLHNHHTHNDYKISPHTPPPKPPRSSTQMAQPMILLNRHFLSVHSCTPIPLLYRHFLYTYPQPHSTTSVSALPHFTFWVTQYHFCVGTPSPHILRYPIPLLYLHFLSTHSWSLWWVDWIVISRCHASFNLFYFALLSTHCHTLIYLL